MKNYQKVIAEINRQWIEGTILDSRFSRNIHKIKADVADKASFGDCLNKFYGQVYQIYREIIRA